MIACAGRWSWTALLTAALGCAEPDAPTSSAAPPRAPTATPTVLFLGCEAVLVGPVCARRPETALSLWVEAPPGARLILEIDGEPRDATWFAAADGLRTVITPAQANGVLTVRDLDLAWQWSLTLQAEAPRAPELLQIDAMLADERHDEAVAAIATIAAGSHGATRAEALKLRGDLEFRRGDRPAALRAYEAAFEAVHAEGLLHSASLVALRAGLICTELDQDFACARRWLERHAEVVAVLPAARMRHAFNTGLLADRQGDLRAAIRGFEQVARDARALGQTRDLAGALLKLGAIRSRLGDGAAGRAAYAELLALPDLTPDDRARAQQSAAWLDLEARARGEAAEDPEPRFAAALALFDRDGARADVFAAAEVRLNLALAALLRDDPPAARAALAPLDPPNRRIQRWQQLLLGRVELAESAAAAALRRFDALAEAAAVAGDPWLRWQAVVSAGEALERLGQVEHALGRYREATALHSLRLAALAVDGGREALAIDGDRGARRLVQLLLRLGRVDEAACAARQARAQAFAGLAAAARDPAALAAFRSRRGELEAAIEQTWRRPARPAEQERTRLRAELRRLDASLDEALTGHDPKDMSEAPAAATPACATLPAPAPGELLLVVYPLDRGHIGFALDEASTTASEIPELASAADARAAQILAPFAAAIDRAAAIRVLASGPAAAVAFHALPWRGRPLVEHAPVTYSLDLPRRVAAHRPRTAVQLAPVSNLARSEDELAAVAAALRTRGITSTRLTGGEPDVRERLGVDLLHYVGHARGDGWASALDLGGERRLTAGDLLGGPAPTVAVLGGCETGLPDPRAHAGGMSLAHALLLAGSAAVIATDAQVDDDLAAAMVPTLLAALADGLDPGVALRQAQLAHAEQADWARFRAFVP